MDLISLLTASFLSGQCADFSGTYKIENEPTLTAVSIQQSGCETVHFSYDGKSYTFYLDGQSRVIVSQTMAKVVQGGRINRKYMMIYLTISYFDWHGVNNKEGVMIFEKGEANDAFLTFKGDVPDKIQAEKKYHLIKQEIGQRWINY